MAKRMMDLNKGEIFKIKAKPWFATTYEVLVPLELVPVKYSPEGVEGSVAYMVVVNVSTGKVSIRNDVERMVITSKDFEADKPQPAVGRVWALSECDVGQMVRMPNGLRWYEVWSFDGESGMCTLRLWKDGVGFKDYNYKMEKEVVVKED